MFWRRYLVHSVDWLVLFQCAALVRRICPQQRIRNLSVCVLWNNFVQVSFSTHNYIVGENSMALPFSTSFDTPVLLLLWVENSILHPFSLLLPVPPPSLIQELVGHHSMLQLETQMRENQQLKREMMTSYPLNRHKISAMACTEWKWCVIRLFMNYSIIWLVHYCTVY